MGHRHNRCDDSGIEAGENMGDPYDTDGAPLV